MSAFTRFRKLLFVSLIVAFIIAGIAYYWTGTTSGIKPFSSELKLGKAKHGDIIQRVTIAGTVIPNRRTIVAAPYSGYVRKVFVKIGQTVKPGDPVVSITQSLQSSDPVFPLRAPFSGTVVQVEKSEGEYVKEGDPKEFIVRIDDLTKIFIVANAPEIDRVKVILGQEALIKASAILNKSYKGIIREMSLAAKDREQFGRSQVEFPIRIEVLNPDSELSPGMSVVIDIITNKKTNVLTLGHEFLYKEGEKYFVTLKNGSKRYVTIGLQDEQAFEITSGLKEGEQVKQVDFAALSEG